MRFIFIILISIITVKSVTARSIQQILDSAFAELQVTPDSNKKVFLLCDISANYFSINSDSGIYYGKKALKLAKQLDFTHGIALANKAIGRCYAIQGLYPEALTYFNTALVEARKIRNDDIEAAVLVSLGSVYSQRDETEQALKYYMQAKEAYIKAGKNTAVISHSIGNIYHHQRRYEESLAAYLDAVAQYEKEKKLTKALARSYTSAGAAYAEMGQYSEAFAYYFKGLGIQKELGLERSMAYTFNSIGTTYLFAATKPDGNLPDTLKNKTLVLQKSLKYLKKSAVISERMELMELLEALYKNISDVYKEMGDYRNSLHYYERTIDIGDSLRDFNEEKRFARVEAEFLVKQKTDSLKYANELKDGQIEKRKTERNAIMAILALVGVSGLMLINRQTIRRKKLQAEKQLADAKLKTAQERLTGFTQSLKEKNQLIEDFTAEVERLQALPCSNELLDTKENLEKLQNSIILTEEQWDDFRAAFEEVHVGFFMRLKEKIPGLTPGETRFMALSRLGLSNKEMARMQGIGLSGMRNYKHRMRVKLNIKEDSELEQILADI